MTQTSTLVLHVVVLKTRISTEEEVVALHDLLGGKENILKWSVDRSDCDKVLRIETFNTTTEEIMQLLGHHQIFCEELPD
ncbi:MAG: hypothetical protein V4616_12145 [Bacteroidota bacterium]